MKKLGLIIGAALLLQGCGSEAEQPLRASDAWVRATAPSQQSSAAYLTLSSERADLITGVTVDSKIAAKASLHQTVTDHSGHKAGVHKLGSEMGPEMSKMRAVQSIPVRKGETKLKPGGYHIMLEGLRGQIGRGEKVKLVLQSEKQGKLKVTAQGRY